jgi:outer membrane lipoprotein LolB
MLFFWVACLLWLAGCAQPTQRENSSSEEEAWSGRIALQVEGQASQSFSALFELRGNAQRGGLALTSPLGNRLAELEWNDGHAQLTSSQETRTSDSLDALLQDVTGTRIPVAALFSWLKGNQTTVPGWRADVSALEQGRLVAHRDEPAPQATLRIALTR